MSSTALGTRDFFFLVGREAKGEKGNKGREAERTEEFGLDCLDYRAEAWCQRCQWAQPTRRDKLGVARGGHIDCHPGGGSFMGTSRGWQGRVTPAFIAGRLRGASRI